MAKLLAFEGEKVTTHKLGWGEATIGRHPECNIQLESMTVSRRHARIYRNQNQFFLQAMQTLNGTYVNGQRITEERALRHGDQIGLGTVKLRFESNTTESEVDSKSITIRDHFQISIRSGAEDSSRIVGEMPVSDHVEATRPEAKLAAILEISRSLATATDLEDILPRLLQTLLEACFPQAERGTILLKNAETGEMMPAAQFISQDDDEGTVMIADPVVVLSRTVLNRVLDEKRGILSSDAASDSRFQASSSIADLNVRSMMCVPMLSHDGEAIGLISIDTTNRSRDFNKDDMDLLMAIAGQAALSYNSTRQMLQRQRLQSDMEVERHRSLSQMVAGIAHEINTPLGIVNTSASLVGELIQSDQLRACCDNDDLRQLIDDITEATRLMQGNIARANHLIENFKKLSVRQLIETKEDVDLGRLIEEVVSLFKIQARREGLEVAIRNPLSPEQARWSGFPGYLSQILLNLMTNVARYAYPEGQGGRIEIEMFARNKGDQPQLGVAVRDFGSGIPPENHARVFAPFFTTGRDRGGTGLGLAIVYNLVTASLHGTIEFDSKPGKGTTFIITFPANVPASPGELPGAAKPQP